MNDTGKLKAETSGVVSGAANMPLLNRDDYAAPSVFLPQSLLREARRQKALPESTVPPVCVLDPDGDLVAHARQQFGATQSPHWACYHTQMWEWGGGANRIGIIGFVVGGPFAVLVAEQLFASGCELLISITSAGQIVDVGPPPYYVLIDRALRDEGTSYHYLPPSDYANADPTLIASVREAVTGTPIKVHVGAAWTTDAPYRETEQMIDKRKAQGILAVEMESAALYAFATARNCPVICLAHVSNQLGCVEGDFEKGEGNGARWSAELVRSIAGVRRCVSRAAADTP
jgi:purine-nucleoside phosphorylase